MKNLLAVLVLTLFTTLLVHSTPAHSFELHDFKGQATSLDDVIGNDKWTLVMFWAHDCGICKAEFPALSEFNSRRGDVEVVGISIDGSGKKHLAQDFLASSKPSFDSYISDLSLVAFNYEALTEENFRGTPTFLLFTPKGELLGNNPGKLSIEALENFIAKNSEQKS